MNASENDKKSKFSGELDPEIADLMGIDTSVKEDTPDFTDLFCEKKPKETDAESVDLSKESFPQITKFEEHAKPFFDNKDYYKQALSEGGELSQRVHKILTQFLGIKDTKERSLYRGKLISACWNLTEKIASGIHTKLLKPKLLLLRYGVLLPTLISSEQKIMLSKIIFENKQGEPVWYVDEWLNKVAANQINPSSTDEVKHAPKNENIKLISQIEKARGDKEIHISSIRKKTTDLESFEYDVKQKVNLITTHDIRSDYDGIKASYNTEQKQALGELPILLRQMGTLDKEIAQLYQELEKADNELSGIQGKADELGDKINLDSQSVVKEFITVRQMIKMCIGRQGNHLPLLMKQYIRSNMQEIGTRENVIMHMAQIESLDSGVFKRTFKRQTNRIVPYVVLVPCYGDRGICWEPFERYNRATSRGRIAIPMYPKDLKTAVIMALGDLRWQVAKEKAQHYWMEEGLTGRYYQRFTERKIRGDVREYFIQDYLLWLCKESEGTQKLDKEIRSIFWRYIPFPQDIKETLRKRGFVYNDLYKKDLNREKSDGY